MELIAWFAANFGALILAIQGALVALLALALIIPGDQPDKFLQGAVDFVTKFSRK